MLNSKWMRLFAVEIVVEIVIEKALYRAAPENSIFLRIK